MISVGIDVSKGKSTVCAFKPYGEVLMTPRDFKRTKDDLDSLVKQLVERHIKYTKKIKLNAKRNNVKFNSIQII